MKEQSVLESYIVRIYRVNTENPRKINGLLEAMDGSGEREPFADIDELGAIVNRRAKRPRKRGRQKAKPGDLKQ